ncbi:FAD/NAD(P)-binding domain-containing protein [Auriculariales sp. MPI-PUGE-AT-0066]|nr:FAD/NAD(P)-binding domain-containing protein [Auriculariales sp. MPI-PUGE-AT-0066]
MVSSELRNIVVIGGGFANNALLSTLLPKLDSSKYIVTLIDTRPFYVHQIATARAITTDKGKLEDLILVPYDRLLTKPHRMVVGNVVSVHAASQAAGATSGGEVELDDGSRVAYDILVVATGSRWPDDFTFPETHDEIISWLRNSRDSINAARNVVVAGGGSVGLEVAGEIRSFHPHVEVTVVQKGKGLLNGTYPSKFRNTLAQKAEAQGIKLIFEDMLVSEIPDKDGFVHTSNGKRLPADRVIHAVGTKPNTSLLRSLGPDTLTSSGFVRVLPTLQLPSHPTIFAAGDIIDWDEQKMAAKAGKHGTVIAANILALTQGVNPSTKYTGFIEAIIVPLGPNGGAGYIPLFCGLAIHGGDWMARFLKSADLMITGARKRIGY